MATTTSRNGPEGTDWDCVEPSSLETGALADANDSEAPACPAGKVPIASARMPVRKKIGLAFDAIKKLFGYAEDMRRSKAPK